VSLLVHLTISFIAIGVLAGANAGDVVIDTVAAGTAGQATIFELAEETAPVVLGLLLPQEFITAMATMINTAALICAEFEFLIFVSSIKISCF
jgi:hypothetical protein